MTRLIDADEIEYTMLYKENWITGSGAEAQGVWKTTIDAMPTVDAIPLDWIMKWYQRRVSGRKNYKAATTMVIRELLDAWDAERNEE